MKKLVLFLPLAAAACAAHRPAPVAPPPPVAPPAAVAAAPAPPPPARPLCKVRVKRDVDRYADLDSGAAADVFRQVAALKRGIAQREAREKKLEAAIRFCGGQTK